MKYKIIFLMLFLFIVNSYSLFAECVVTVSVEGDPDSLVCSESNTKLILNFENFVNCDTTDASYQWYFEEDEVDDGTNETLEFDSIDADDAGEYKVEVLIDTVIYSATIVLEVIDFEVKIVRGTMPLCIGNEIVLMGSANGNPFGDLSFEWSGVISDNNMAKPVLMNTSMEYSLKITDEQGCSDSIGITLNVNPLPVIVFDPTDPVICDDDPLFVTANPGMDSAPFISVQWDDDSSDNPLVIDTPLIDAVFRTWEVMVTDTNGCRQSNSIIIKDSELEVKIDGFADVCSGTTVWLNANDTGSNNPISYNWVSDNPLSNNTIQNPFTGSLDSPSGFNVVVTDNVTGCMVSDSFTINVHPQPYAIDINQDPSLVCPGQDVNLKVSFSGGVPGVGPELYVWSTPGLPVPFPLTDSVFETEGSPSIYDLTLEFDSLGCQNVLLEDIAINVADNLDPHIINFLDGTIICNNQRSIYGISNISEGSDLDWILTPANNILVDSSFIVDNLLIIYWNSSLMNNQEVNIKIIESVSGGMCPADDEISVVLSESQAGPIAEIFLNSFNNILVYNDSTACEYNWGVYNGETFELLPNGNFQSFGPIDPNEEKIYFCIASDLDCNCSNIAVFRGLEENSPIDIMDRRTVLFPNPNTGKFKLESNKLEVNTEYKINIFNSLGGEVFTETARSNEDLLSLEFDLEFAQAGIYFLAIEYKDRIIDVISFLVHTE